MSYFIRIDDTQEVRRRALENSKDLIKVLKGYHLLIEIRVRKKEKATELRRVMAEITALGARLDKLLPTQPLDEVKEFLPKREAHKKAEKPKAEKKHEAAQKAEKKAEPKKEAPPKPRPLTEVERLEQALSSIEKRLGNL